MLDSGRGYHEPAALELIEGYHGQQKQPQATWSIRSNLIHTTHPRRDSQSTKLEIFPLCQALLDPDSRSRTLLRRAFPRARRSDPVVQRAAEQVRLVTAERFIWTYRSSRRNLLR